MEPTRKPAGSLRLTFQYRDRSVQLIDVRPVDAIAPQPPPSPGGSAGYWLEVHPAGGQDLGHEGVELAPVFRRVLHEPLADSVELLSDDPERSFQRADVESPSGTFQVMIPAVEDAEVVLRHVDPRRPLRDDDEGDVLGRFDLSDWRAGGQ